MVTSIVKRDGAVAAGALGLAERLVGALQELLDGIAFAKRGDASRKGDTEARRGRVPVSRFDRGADALGRLARRLGRRAGGDQEELLAAMAPL